MKRILIATVLAIGLTTAGGYAYTHSKGIGSEYSGHRMEQEMMDDYGNNDGDREYYHPGTGGLGRNCWTSDQQQKFLDDTVELRKEMYGKRLKYKETLKHPQNTRQQLSKMEKEMIILRDKIYDKAPQNQAAKQNELAEQNN